MVITNVKSRRQGGNLVLVLVLMLSLYIGVGQITVATANAAASASVPTAELDATVATQWMHLLYKCVSDESFSPPVASRVYAYAGITLYESVLPGMPGNHSLSGQLRNLPALPRPDANLVYDWSSSANGALAIVIDGLMPAASADTRAQLATLRDKLVV